MSYSDWEMRRSLNSDSERPGLHLLQFQRGFGVGQVAFRLVHSGLED